MQSAVGHECLPEVEVRAAGEVGVPSPSFGDDDARRGAVPRMAAGRDRYVCLTCSDGQGGVALVGSDAGTVARDPDEWMLWIGRGGDRLAPVVANPAVAELGDV